MKRLVCEMCGGTDLVKQDGVFVCQNCGTKYSVEEAKKMMVEGAVTVEGTVAVEGTVKVDKTEELKKLYTLARRAKESDNTENACRYYTQIEMQDPDSWEAYFYLIYFKARTTKIADIPEDCKNLTNCFATTMDLLFKSSANEDEIRTSLNMILADIKHIADIMLNSVDSLTADSIDLENYSGDALIDALPYKASILKMMDSLGDSIVANKKYIDIAAVVWKSEIELFMAHYGEFKTYDPLKTTYSYFVKGSSTKLKLAHKSSNFADGVAKYLIPDVAKKIYEIDPTYDDPFGVSKELRKNEKFITCPKCGTKMREREEKCPQCGISKEEIQRLIKEQAEREAAERERIRKEREAQEAEDARICAEKRKAWWQKNRIKVIVTIVTIIALVIGVIVYSKMAEKKKYQQALATAKAYIASGDSCVAVYRFEEAQEFYEKARHTGTGPAVEYEVSKKESELRNAQNKMRQKQERLERERIAKEELEKKTEEEAKQRMYDNPVIPSGTTKIPRYAYAGKAIKSIIIPNSVTSIGCNAFENCSSLTSITLPNSITNLEGGIFRGCTRLTSVTLPSSITNIGSGTFEGCSNLKSITIPNSVTSIGGCTFHECSSLTSIKIPNNVTSMGQTVFSGCVNLKVINLPENLKKIDNFTFRSCYSLETISIPENVNRIGEDAFLNCTSLSTIICRAKTPPIISRTSFDGVDKSIPVYVPASSVEAYKNADLWGKFTNIKAIRE